MEKLYRLYGIALRSQCVPLQATLSLLIFILLTTTGQAQVNAYARVTAINVSGGKSVLSISNVSQTYHTFAVGEQVLVIQMQDNVINGTGNNSSFGMLTAIGKAGQYEEATISSIAPSTAAPTSITLTGTLMNSYVVGNNSSVQVVSFAKLSATNFTTTANITAVPWSGSLGRGGVVAFQVPGVLTLKNSITVDGQGFAGGAASANYGSSCEPSVYITSSTNYGAKGEGIYMINTASNPTFARGRARVVSGGGGGSSLKAGGAGGSNYSAGGDGGSGGTYGTDCSGSGYVSGGMGGVALGSYSAVGTRIFMGGGGGGGNGNGGQTAGGNGGGIIIIKAGTLTTSCSSSSISISANGNDADNSGYDGAGGAGAAGTILLQVGTYSVPANCSLNIQANGGDGGSSDGFFNFNVGSGGGGGGQGAVLFSGSSLPTSHITTTTSPGDGGQNGFFPGTSASNGTGTGNAGVIVGVGIVLPVRLVYFAVENKSNKAVLSWTSEDESNVTYHVQRSTDGINFTTIGSVTGTGSGNYSFTDPNPESGRNYYRLEMAGNISSQTSLSTIVTLNLSDIVKVLVAYPNPAHDHFNIRISGENNNKTYLVTITDLTGQLIYTTTSKPANSIISVTPNRPLKPGLYMFKVTSDGTEQTGKLMIR